MKLSVVMPFHNVADYLAAALESIARQTLDDLEVILVNDGSTDGSSHIAESYVARDRRFRLFEQENAGLGAARNAGTQQAAGDYLAFADGDDVVSPYAYDLLTRSLQKTGSDIASGAIRRLTAAGTRPARLYEPVFQQTRLGTHVSRFPLLIQDRVACNKVFRRSFWDAHGFAFPGGLYEDAPVTVRAHVLASAVDVLADIVYYWRVREQSITGRYWEIANIEQRMATVREVDRFLVANAPELKPANDASVLRRDIRMLVQACEQAGDGDRARIAEIAAAYLETVDPAVYEAVPMSDRLRAFLLGQRKLPELLEVLRFERSAGAVAAPVAVRGAGGQPRWLARYPFLGDPAHGIPAGMYDITSEMTLAGGVESVGWRGSKLRITGHAYIRWVSSADPAECRIRVALHGSKSGRPIWLPVSRMARPGLAAPASQAAISYEWSGFAVEVPVRRLAGFGRRWRDEDWELRVEVVSGDLSREGPIGSAGPGSAQWPVGRWVSRGIWLQPGLEHGRRFLIRIREMKSHVTACTRDRDMLRLEGWTTQPLTGEAAVLVSQRRNDAAAVRAAARPAPSSIDSRPWSPPRQPGQPRGTQRFSAAIPVSALVRDADPASAIDRSVHVHDESMWEVSLSPGPGEAAARLSIDPGVTGARAAVGGREVTAVASPFGYLALLERAVRPVVTGVEWSGEGSLVLRGDYCGEHDRPAAGMLRHSGSGSQQPVPLEWDGSAFTAALTPIAAADPAAAQPGPVFPACGLWQLLAPGGAGTREVAVALDRRLLPSLPGRHPLGAHEAELEVYNNDALRLRVT